jgi:glycosyltransferase involved in cell wall biosynthesis
MRPTVGVLVGEGGNWQFFQEIFADLARRYETRLYEEKVYRTPLLYGRLNRWAYRRRIRSLLRHSDLCFFEWASELLAVATHMPKYCPVVTRLHAFELYAWAPRINWERVDKIIVVSEAMARQFIARHPDCAGKLRVVYNGVSLQRFTPALGSSGLELGMLGAIRPRKRLYEAVLMLDGLRRDLGLPARLHVGGGWAGDAGSERYYQAVRHLVRKLDLEEHVLFHGHVVDTPQWFRQIDIFISNSYSEGQQVALLEAMAAECCCFSHTWDGAEEVVPPDHLYTTSAELQAKIGDYVQQPEEERQRRRARMRTIAAQRFDIETTKARIRAVIDETLSGRAESAVGLQR